MRAVSLRSLVFWPHLVAGVIAGAIILVMSVTGVLLTYEKQMIAWADGRAPIAAHGRARLDPETLVARVADQAGALPTSLVVASRDRPVLASVSQKTLLIDPYSGAVLGESAPRLRRFFRQVTDWHRWLALSGERRVAGRAVTGWSNVLFLFLVLSGMYLWLPRIWNRTQFRAIAWFRGGLSGKARDFNWHNAIGIWTAIPLALVVASAMPISFPWANALVYRIVGETPPSPAPRAATTPSRPPRPEAATLQGLSAAWRTAERHAPDWRTITVRVPATVEAPFVFTIDRGSAGQPQYRGTLTIARAGGEPRWEPFAAQSLGRRVRSISRFLHTGEVLGLAGQTIAGVATLGSVFLVWTGIGLALRRLFAWKKRSARDTPSSLAA